MLTTMRIMHPTVDHYNNDYDELKDPAQFRGFATLVKGKKTCMRESRWNSSSDILVVSYIGQARS